ncbi:MAG: FKBP-type peptidyl-prolyl cis-trans isomerase [Clostridiaceae bacterium]|nr:FKBP-type peptidyl-prolyl cis-trans isomerase [Clostridiaceae bacterium]
MKKSYRIISAALCAVLSVSLLNGCSLPGIQKNTQQTDSSDSSESSEEETEKLDPVIENAGDYVTLADYSTVTLKTSDIEDEIESNKNETLESYATYKKIKTGKVEDGDTVNIYYVGKLDGEAFDGGTCSKKTNPEGYDLEIGSGTFVDGFEDALIGKKIGKTYKIKVTFPETYTQNEDLAGQDTVFTVTINYKQGKKILPEFNNKFVKKYLTSYKSVKDYEKKTRKTIIQNLAIKQVVNDSTVDSYPEERVTAKIESMRSVIEESLTSAGSSIETYLEAQGMTEEDYETQLESSAKDDIGTQLIYYAIAQKEGLEVEESEYEEALETYLSNYNCDSEEDLDDLFLSYYGSDAKTVLYMNIMYSNIAEFLAERVEEE